MRSRAFRWRLAATSSSLAVPAGLLFGFSSSAVAASATVSCSAGGSGLVAAINAAHRGRGGRSTSPQAARTRSQRQTTR